MAGLIIALVLILWSMPATAKIYRYTDAAGAVCFTDDINRVPAGQRHKVRTYNSYHSSNQNPASNDKKKIKKTHAPYVPDKDYESAKGPKLPEEVQAFRKQQAALDNEYALLMKRKIELEKAGRNIRGKTAMLKHNVEIEALNKAIKAYGRKRAKLNEAITAYNLTLK